MIVRQQGGGHMSDMRGNSDLITPHCSIVGTTKSGGWKCDLGAETRKATTCKWRPTEIKRKVCHLRIDYVSCYMLHVLTPRQLRDWR